MTGYLDLAANVEANLLPIIINFAKFKQNALEEERGRTIFNEKHCFFLVFLDFFKFL